MVLQLFGIVVVCTLHVATCLEEEDICGKSLCRRALYSVYWALYWLHSSIFIHQCLFRRKLKVFCWNCAALSRALGCDHQSSVKIKSVRVQLCLLTVLVCVETLRDVYKYKPNAHIMYVRT